MRSKMEKYFADNRTYLDPVAACDAAAQSVGNPATDYFAITCAAGHATATTYTVRATGHRRTRNGRLPVHHRPDECQGNARRPRRAGRLRHMLGHAQGRLLLMDARLHRGFTLIELLVAMTIAHPAAGAGHAWLHHMDGRQRDPQWRAVGRQRPALCAVRPPLPAIATRSSCSARPAGTWRWSTPRWCRSRRPAFSEGAKHVILTGVDTTAAAATTMAFNRAGTGHRRRDQSREDRRHDALGIASTRPLRVQVGNGGARRREDSCDQALRSRLGVGRTRKGARHDRRPQPVPRGCALADATGQLHARGADRHLDRRAGHTRGRRPVRALRCRTSTTRSFAARPRCSSTRWSARCGFPIPTLREPAGQIRQRRRRSPGTPSSRRMVAQRLPNSVRADGHGHGRTDVHQLQRRRSPSNGAIPATTTRSAGSANTQYK